MPTYRLLIEYDGTKFFGWQVQPNTRTVQGVLLDTCRELLGDREIDIQGAGRTDTGVHALGQVASLRCRVGLQPTSFLTELDRALPQDLAVVGIREALRSFHARHDATARAYRYQIARRRSAFGKRYSWWIPEPLKADAMTKAAGSFIGRHDFRALARRAGELDSTLVEVERCDVVSDEDVLLIRIVASHFLWNQVRRMVGCLVSIGRGEAKAEDVPLWLSGQLQPPHTAAPGAGLFLEAVRYRGDDWNLPPLEAVGLPRHPYRPPGW
jgi:tRNA pseudouridine38-40 synthase